MHVVPFLFLYSFRRHLTDPLNELTQQIEDLEIDDLSGVRLRIHNTENNELNVNIVAVTIFGDGIEDEWQSGEHLFFNDWIAPYGNIRSAMHDIATHVFPHHTATSIRRHQDGSIRKINYWQGMTVRQQREAKIRGLANA